MNHLQTQQRLHWSSLLFDLIAQIRSIFVPAILGAVGAARGSMFWVSLSAIFIFSAMFYSLVRWLTLRYQIQDGNLQISHGYLFRHVRAVPLDQIQNIDFVQNILHRMFGVAEVRVETAAGSEPEAKLRVISMDQVERLRKSVFVYRATLPASETLTTDQHSTDSLAKLDPLAAGGQVLLQIPTLHLVLAGLANDRGILLVGALLGVVVETKMFQRIDFKKLAEFFPQLSNTWILIVGSITAFVLVIIILRTLSIGWYLLRFANYKLSKQQEDLRISCGLATKVHATVPQQRIQFLSVQRNLWMRLLGLCSVRIETASAGTRREDASTSVSGRWFIPVIAESQLPEIIDQLRPGLIWDENSIDFKPLARLARKRFSRISAIIPILLSMWFAWMNWYWACGAAVISVPLAVLWARRHIARFGYARTEQGVWFRSGWLTRCTSVTFFEKIQAVGVSQSPFDRRWGMACLSVDTAAAGPAEHRIVVPMLDKYFAESEFHELTAIAARNPLSLHLPKLGSSNISRITLDAT